MAEQLTLFQFLWSAPKKYYGQKHFSKRRVGTLVHPSTAQLICVFWAPAARPQRVAMANSPAWEGWLVPCWVFAWRPGGEGQFLASPEQPTRRDWAWSSGQQFACHLLPTPWVREGFYDICVTAHHFSTSLLNKLLLLLLLLQSHLKVPVKSEHWEDLPCLCGVLRYSGDPVTASERVCDSRRLNDNFAGHWGPPAQADQARNQWGEGPVFYGFPGGLDGQESACNEEDLGSASGSGRSPGEGNSYSFQCSCLENSIDRGAWWTTVHGVARVRCDWVTNTFTCTYHSVCTHYVFWRRFQ